MLQETMSHLEVCPFRIYWNEVGKGGHFAWEKPELFTEEVRAAFKSLR